MDKKIIRNDIILIVALLLVAVISLIVVSMKQSHQYSVASVYVQNKLVETIRLNQNSENDYYVHGLNGDLHIHTKNGGIAVVESNCPHQDCVKMGYVYSSNKPIICAYNACYIVIDGGNATYDVEI